MSSDNRDAGLKIKDAEYTSLLLGKLGIPSNIGTVGNRVRYLAIVMAAHLNPHIVIRGVDYCIKSDGPIFYLESEDDKKHQIGVCDFAANKRLEAYADVEEYIQFVIEKHLGVQQCSN